MHTRNSRRRCVPALGLVALPLVLLALAAPVQAEKIDKRRADALERMNGLGHLHAVVSLEQPAAGVFFVHPRDPEDHGYRFYMATQPSITGGTFAGGAASVGFTLLLDAAASHGELLRMQRESQARLLALGTRDDFDAMHAIWRDIAARAVAESEWVTGEVVIAREVDREARREGGPCPQRDHCLWVDTRWGLSWDGLHVETQTTVAVWSPHLRKAGARAGRDPDFSNLLVYLSDPLELSEVPSDEDREALRRAAMQAYEFYGIPALVEQTRSGGKVEANAARRTVIPLLETHRKRMRRAGAARWTPDSQAFRRAQIWGADDGARLVAALDEARAETDRMLRIELSRAGQAAKTRLRHRNRERYQVASVMADGGRRIVYLNHGTLVSLPDGVEFTQVWPLHYSEAIDYASTSEAPAVASDDDTGD
jgi:hypothetical protein